MKGHLKDTAPKEVLSLNEISDEYYCLLLSQLHIKHRYAKQKKKHLCQKFWFSYNICAVSNHAFGLQIKFFYPIVLGLHDYFNSIAFTKYVAFIFHQYFY